MKTTTRMVRKTCSRTKKTMKTRTRTIRNWTRRRKRTKMKNNTKPGIIRKTWTNGTKKAKTRIED